MFKIVEDSDRCLQVRTQLAQPWRTPWEHKSQGVVAFVTLVRRPDAVCVTQMYNTSRLYRGAATVEERERWRGAAVALFWEALSVVRERWALDPEAVVTLEASGTLGVDEDLPGYGWTRPQLQATLRRLLGVRGSQSLPELRFMLASHLGNLKLVRYYEATLGFRQTQRPVGEPGDPFFIPMDTTVGRLSTRHRET